MTRTIPIAKKTKRLLSAHRARGMRRCVVRQLRIPDNKLVILVNEKSHKRMAVRAIAKTIKSTEARTNMSRLSGFEVTLIDNAFVFFIWIFNSIPKLAALERHSAGDFIVTTGSVHVTSRWPIINELAFVECMVWHAK
jgi:hypothetical protein